MPRVFWFTGLSGAGKSTLAGLLQRELASRAMAVVQIDGDVLRGGLCRDLGFTEADRDENIRRAAEVARLLAEQGVTVICSLISPRTAQRRMAREIVGDSFFEVFVDCPLHVLRQRDPKGLYARADRGEIPLFTGVSAPYEAPDDPEFRIDTSIATAEDCLNSLLARLDV